MTVLYTTLSNYLLGESFLCAVARMLLTFLGGMENRKSAARFFCALENLSLSLCCSKLTLPASHFGSGSVSA